MRILITGGTGYIGSHTSVALLQNNHEVLIYDNLSNSSSISIKRIKSITKKPIEFVEGDIRDNALLLKVISEFSPDAIIHFAGLKAVGESVIEPAHYYDVNVGGTAVLLGAMVRANCKNIVFSSSATVYGEPQYLPCDENHPLEPINPYGRTKLTAECLLRDWANASDGRHATALRYFNPVGADISGKIGEDPYGTPNNLMPLIAQVAMGRKDCLGVFGDDFDTIDGTGIRDYIHVSDLACAHVLAVKHIKMLEPYEVFNIGTGNGLTVLQMVREFENQSGQTVKFKIVSRRPGDAQEVWADVSKAKNKLGFEAVRGVAEMCRDTWNWQSTNPEGYK